MELYTIHRNKENLAKSLGYTYLDTTVKGGTSILAPTWDMVMGVKDWFKGIGNYTEEDYTRDYERLLARRYRDNPDAFHDIALMDRVAFCCYCRPGDFCHRLLLVDFFERLCGWLGIEFHYLGELR